MTGPQPYLAYGRQSINESDIEAVIEALRSDFLTTGPMVDRFEAALCDFTGANETIVVANGTAALHLAILSLDLTPQDVVIVPSITFVASANAVAFCGARVVFADVDPKTGLMTTESFTEALSQVHSMSGYRFAGVIPVHYAGRPIDLTEIAATCHKLGAFILEDACHAIGTKGPQGQIGSCQLSDMATFSFHPVKTLTTGEGGAIFTNNKARAARLRQIRSHGLERQASDFRGLGFGDDNDFGPWVYEMQALGYNYRLPDINCALGLSQLKRMDFFAKRRKALVKAYEMALNKTNLSVFWEPLLPDVDAVFHLMAVRIDFEGLGKTRTEVMTQLKTRGIGTQVHYVPVHHQPYWRDTQLAPRPLKGADRFYKTTLSLPLYADMSDDDPNRVVTALSEVLAL
jgi:UDP-4-amino-4,6-dideoxy-N-acetyl-beta-L-altrosamine transaminase